MTRLELESAVRRLDEARVNLELCELADKSVAMSEVDPALIEYRSSLPYYTNLNGQLK